MDVVDGLPKYGGAVRAVKGVGGGSGRPSQLGKVRTAAAARFAAQAAGPFPPILS